MRNIVLYLTVLLYPTLTYAQLKVKCTLTTTGVNNISVDRLGNFYFVMDDNCIQKRDSNGILLQETEFPTANVSLLEAWNPLRIFVYTKKNQYYTLLDPRLNVLEKHSIDPPPNLLLQQLCPANNKLAWGFDSIGSALKKINLHTMNVEADIPLGKNWSAQKGRITFLRAYQDELFVLDNKTGIHIFNHIGIPIGHIPVVGLTNFNFIGEELCYRKAGKLFLVDLYTRQERLWQDISHIKNINFVIGTDERLVVVANSTIYFFEVML